MQVQMVQEVAKMGRHNRTPKHSFNVMFKPWVIQPNMIAPVLPGETMSNLLFQCSARTDALRSDTIGWWFEQYFFYVKHRDLDQRDLITQMHLDPATDMSSVRAANRDFVNCQFKGGVNWVTMCRDAVIREYFRDEGEALLVGAIDGLPIARSNIENFTDSMMFDSQAPVKDDLLPGEVNQLPDQGIPPGFEAAYDHWQSMRAMQLYTATFEDYLKSFGVSPARELKVDEIHRPELIRYVREWSVPQVKFVEELGGAAPRMQWNIAERADKDRFFSEPGFIIGLCVARPKMYMGSLGGSGVGMLDNAYAWLPAVLSDEPYTSLRKYAANTGPYIVDVDGDYWVDVKDLFMHGDQFWNLPEGPKPATDRVADNMVNLPRKNAGKFDRRYAQAADFATIFRDVAKCWVRSEGVVSLTIKSRLQDTSLSSS